MNCMSNLTSILFSVTACLSFWPECIKLFNIMCVSRSAECVTDTFSAVAKVVRDTAHSMGGLQINQSSVALPCLECARHPQDASGVPHLMILQNK